MFAVAAIKMVTGFGPQLKVITPPLATAATKAAEVQLAGVPVPTTVVGLATLAGCAAAGIAQLVALLCPPELREPPDVVVPPLLFELLAAEVPPELREPPDVVVPPLLFELLTAEVPPVLLEPPDVVVPPLLFELLTAEVPPRLASPPAKDRPAVVLLPDDVPPEWLLPPGAALLPPEVLALSLPVSFELHAITQLAP